MSKEFIFELDNSLYNEETGEAVFKPKVKGELVRCKECKNGRTCKDGRIYCIPHNWGYSGEYYCAWGQRKEQTDATD